MKTGLTIFFFSLLLLLAACDQQGAPTGTPTSTEETDNRAVEETETNDADAAPTTAPVDEAADVDEAPAPAVTDAEPPVEAPIQPTVTPEQSAMDADALAMATRVIDQMVEAYGKAPAFIERIAIKEFTRDRLTAEADITVIAGKGTDAMIASRSGDFYCIDGEVFATAQGIASKYLGVPMYQNLVDTCRKKLGLGVRLSVGLDARYKVDRDDLLLALAHDSQGKAEVVRYRLLDHPAGGKVHNLVLQSAGGLTYVDIDPETFFVRGMDVVRVSTMGDATFQRRLSMAMSTKVFDELPAPITFNPGNRQRVDTYQKLLSIVTDEMELLVKVGDEAPDFEEITLEGTPITLSSFRGKVVALVFWAAAVPDGVRMARELPELKEWADERGGIVILPCNAHEHGRTVADRQLAADTWWNEAQIRMQSVLDGRDRISRAWGLDAVPVTVIIDAEGIVTDIISGHDELTAGKVKAALVAATSS